MNHLERLVRRALAVPRDRPQGVFDPFDQSLPWPLDAIAALPAATGAPLPEERVVAPAQSTPPRLGMPVATAARAATSAPVPSSAPPPGPPAVPAAVSAPRRPQQPASVTALPPQARADAFMRALGVATPQVDVPVAVAPTPAATVVSLEPVARSSTPSATVPRETPSILPVARARAEAVPASPRQRVPAPPTVPPSAPSAATPHRPVAAPPAVQIIRTPPAAPRPPALDDLARGSHIVRFGIGQD